MTNNDDSAYISVLQNKTLFGLLNMPRFPILHMAVLMLLGGVSILVQVARAYSNETLKAIVLKGESLQTHADVHLWPTCICIVMVFCLHRTLSFRRLVRSVLALGREVMNEGHAVQISEEDAEEVALSLRSTWIGHTIAVVMFLFFLLLQFVLTIHMVYIYIKFII